MSWLLIDLSNSRTKFRLGTESGLDDWQGILPTADLSAPAVNELLRSQDFSAVVIASVVPDKEEMLRGYFKEKAPYYPLTFQSPLEFGFSVPHPEQIGNDRLANLNALAGAGSLPAIAIDLGTAVTFSVLSNTGDFLGGAITPGMDCMVDYLSEKTAQLPRASPEFTANSIGKNTLEALQIGSAIGQRGMIREILGAILKELAEPATVIATGGGAPFMKGQVEEIDRIEPSLTHEGLRILAKRIFP